MRQRVTQPRLRGALSQTVITRVLPEESRIKKDAEEVSGSVVSDRSTEAFSISCCTHPIGGIVLIQLRGGGIPGCADIIQRIRSALHEHVEFIRGGKRAWTKIVS